jgi:N4-gp56 family major capsid protein
MSEVTISSANQAEHWDEKFFKDYHRGSQFNPYTGASENAVVHVKDISKKPGATTNISLIRKLEGDGVTGNTELDGAEEDLSDYAHPITTTYIRHGVRVTLEEEDKTVMNIRDAGRMMLKLWMQDKIRDEIIRELQCPVIGGGVAYADATETQKDAWLAANADRVLFGALKSNNSSNDHSASLSNCDTTADTFTSAKLSLMKRMAKSPTNAPIRPIRVDGGGEWFVVFAGSDPFRDFSNDSVIISAHTSAMQRGKGNPLFVDGSLVWKGCIIIEVPELLTIGTVGASSAPVHTVLMCGAQALGMAIKSRTKSIVDMQKDYQFRPGVAVQENRGVEKLFFNNVQHGVVTGYFAAAADA